MLAFALQGNVMTTEAKWINIWRGNEKKEPEPHRLWLFNAFQTSNET